MCSINVEHLKCDPCTQCSMRYFEINFQFWTEIKSHYSSFEYCYCYRSLYNTDFVCLDKITWENGRGLRILPFAKSIAYVPIQSKQEYEKEITHLIILF